MSVYNEVFQRVEKKYRVSASQRSEIEEALSRSMQPDGYGRTRVTSVYLDTLERDLIARSLEKPLYKEKLRVRAYGQAVGCALAEVLCDTAMDGCAASCAEAPVFLELKKKFKGVVYKRRVGTSLAAARAYLAGVPYAEACAAYPLADALAAAESLSARSLQIAREIDAAMTRHGALTPSMVIACDRVAWVARSCSAGQRKGLCEDLRVTFDSNLRYLDCGGALAPSTVVVDDVRCSPGANRICRAKHANPGAGWQSVILPSYSIMEVKSAGSLHLWLADALAEVRAYPSSFSKYGAAAQLSHAV